MSDSRQRNKYYRITTTQLVKAPSQTMALRVLNNKREKGGQVLGSSSTAQRITSLEAQAELDSLS